MSSAGGGNSNNNTNDDSFVAFSFAIASMAMVVLYTPWIWGITMGIISQFTSNRNRRDGVSALEELKNTVVAVPCFFLKVVTNPTAIAAGVKLLMGIPALTQSLYLPKFIRFIVRPKILVLWLWVILLSMVMYTSLTFDAHGILGLKQDATVSEVKKAYRKLSKQYHPDQNSTDTARVLYHQVRRAYKALVNKDEFEEEARQEDYSVGVALPSFLTAKENEFFVLFGMLAMMLAIPIMLFLRFRDSGKQLLPTLVEKLKKEQAFVPRFLELLGVPKDRKYAEKNLSRLAILQAVKAAGLAPANASEASISGFPLFPAFISKLQTPAPHMGYLKGLGFDDDAINVMSQYAINSGPAAVEAYEAKLKAVCGDCEGPLTIKASAGEYKAARYLMEMHTEQVKELIDELHRNIPAEVRAARKIITTYGEMYDLMAAVFEREKPLARNIQSLVEIPQQLDEAFDDLVPDIEKLMRKHYRQVMNEQQVGKKTLKTMQRMASRGGGPQMPMQ